MPQRVFRVAPDQDRVQEERESAFVGRAGELADLTALADRSAAREEGWLLTYVGDPGIGKSRLIRQFAASRGEDLRVVSGGADAMSTGAFGPLASWLGSLDTEWEQYVGKLLGDDAAPVMQRLRSAVGRSDAQTSIEDVVWAVQAVLAALCESSPVASVWDDLHWATEAQLDFIGRTAAASRTLPVLTICLARPDLFDVDARWGGGRKSRVEDVVPLDNDDLLAVAAERITLQAKDIDVTAEELAARADGNPQVVQLLAQSAAAGGALPASVTQLYEAALDRLSTDERALVEAAAVYGRRFPLAPVAATAGSADAPDVVGRLRGRNVLEVAGDGEYRFAQAVFMQTAYRTMPKRTRIKRHSELADWIEAHSDQVASDTVALVASHRRRAYELLQEIDGPAEERRSLRERAAQAAMDLLRAQQLRGDPAMPDSIDVLLDLLPTGDQRFFELAYTASLARNAGADPQRWEQWLDRIDAAMSQDQTWRIVRAAPRHLVDIRRGGVTLAAALEEARSMVRQVQQLDRADPYVVDLAVIYLAQVEADLGNLGACHELCLAQAEAAAESGRSIVERVWLNFDLQISYGGNTPLPEVIATARRLQASVAGHRGLWGITTAVLAAALASSGRFEEARRQWEQHTRAFDGVPRAETTYDLQHYQRTVAAEGKIAEAADLAAQLGRRAAEATFVSYAASMHCAAARWALFAGDARAARRHVDDALAIDLPEALDWLRDDASAFTLAVEHALDGDRPAAYEQIEVGSRVDRPEESLDTAGVVHTVTGIVEHLLGDESASRAAADAARDAFDRKGATALRDQVDTWVGNADNLRR